MTTFYQLPDGRQTTDYQAFKDAKADHEAAQAAFDARFGAQLSTPEGRQEAIEVMRTPQKSGSVNIVPASPKFQGGYTEAQVEQFVDAADTGVVNRHGAVVFAVPESRVVHADANGLPPGHTRVSFFGGIPQK
jgi:hypothetical protein